MSLKHIACRDIEYLHAELRTIEEKWENQEIEMACADPQYRRDQVLADVLGLKVDVVTLASAFREYEAIAMQYADMKEMVGGLMDEVVILRHTVALLMRAENMRNKKAVSTNVDSLAAAV